MLFNQTITINKKEGLTNVFDHKKYINHFS